MPGHVRYTEPLLLDPLPSSVRNELSVLTCVRGRMGRWLLQPEMSIAFLARRLDSGLLVGWAAANPGESALGVYVRPRYRRRGIGTELMDRLCAEVSRRWPGVKWTTSTSPGSAGRRFMERHDRRLA